MTRFRACCCEVVGGHLRPSRHNNPDHEGELCWTVKVKSCWQHSEDCLEQRCPGPSWWWSTDDLIWPLPRAARCKTMDPLAYAGQMFKNFLSFNSSIKPLSSLKILSELETQVTFVECSSASLSMPNTLNTPCSTKHLSSNYYSTIFSVATLSEHTMSSAY